MEEINPGIRKLVEELNNAGFRTCDSGDGETHDHSCDRSYPYVVIQLEDPQTLVIVCDDLRQWVSDVTDGRVVVAAMGPSFDTPSIQGTYDPGNRLAFVDLTGVTDKLLWP